MTYFKQQDTSLWSLLRLCFDLCPLWWWFPLEVWWEAIFDNFLCTLDIIVISYSYILSCLLSINRNEIGIKIVFKIFFVMFFYVIVFSVARIWDSWVTSLSHSCIRGCIQGFSCSRFNHYMQTHRIKTD